MNPRQGYGNAMTAGLAAMLLGVVLWVSPGAALAQQGEDPNIFRRFEDQNVTAASKQVLFEVPTKVRPQTDPEAEVLENAGLAYVFSEYPGQRSFGSLGLSMVKSRWVPTDPAYSSSEVHQLDAFASFNFRTLSFVYLNWGFGLGLLDGLVIAADRRVHHSMVPYFSLHMGTIVHLTSSITLSYRAVATPFVGSGPSVGNGRGWVGLGFNY